LADFLDGVFPPLVRIRLDARDDFGQKRLPLWIDQDPEGSGGGKVQLCFRPFNGDGQSGVGAGRAFREVCDVLRIGGVEHEHGNGAGFSVIAHEFVHDVRILVPQKDVQLEPSRFRDAYRRGQFAINIAAPCLCDRKQLARAMGKRGGFAEKPKVIFGERRMVIVLLELIEGALQRALNEFIEHFHFERNHQGKGNVLLFPTAMTTTSARRIGCRERLGGLLRYYSRAA
jgi:hypothetical protein